MCVLENRLSYTPYIGLSAAGAFQLVVHQVGVMRGGDKVVVQWLLHVLVHTLMGWVHYQTLWLMQVHHKAILRHHLICFGCRSGGKTNTCM